MKRHWMLIAGLVAVAASFVGPAVQTPLSEHPGRWWEIGHMSWWSIDDTSAPVSDARAVAVTATDYSFSPSETITRVGEAINITLVNEGSVPHDLVIPELGLHVAAGPNGQSTGGLVLDEPGTFDIVCTVPGHAAAGMRGTLTVELNT